MNKSAPRKKSGSPVPDKFFRFPLSCLVICLVIFIVYAPALFFSLGKLDESNIILDHLAFLSDFKNLKEALLTNPFFHRGGEFYRPLQNLSFMIDAHLSGQNGWGWYLSNILVHGITCCLLFQLMNLVGKERRTALLITMIFAVHPLFVQTVAWVPSRGDLFLAMFGLASLITFIRYIRSGRLLFLYLNILTFGLALLSKETAVVIPVICLIWFVFIEKEKKVSLRRLAVPFAGHALIFIGFMYFRNAVIKIDVNEGQFGIIPFLAHLRTIPEFLFKFFLPVGLGPMPAYRLFNTIIGLLILAGLTFLAIRMKRDQGYIYLFGIAWFLLFVFPTLIFVNKFGTAALDYMEHRAYLPLMGIILIVYVFLTSDLRPRVKNNSTVVLLAILLIFGVYTRIYSRNYKTARSYYDLAVSDNPSSAIAWFNRAATSMNVEKDYTGAIKDYDKSLSILPGYPEAYINRGFCKEQLDDKTGAISDYAIAARLKPAWYEPHVDLATVKRKLGLIKEAISEYDTALALLPSFYQGFNERGSLLMEMQDYRSAMEDFNRAISLNEKYPEAYFNRGLLEFRLQEFDAAMQDYSSAIQLNPKYVEAWVNRGVLKYQVRDFQGSIGDFTEALNLDDKYAEAYLDRGMARYMTDDHNGAREDWETARSLNMPEAQTFLDKYGN